MEQHQFVFDTIDKIRELDKARYNTNYNANDPFIIDVPSAMHRLSIAHLLKIKAFLQIHEGRIDEAYQTIGDIFRLGDWILKESRFLISLIIGYSTLDEGFLLYSIGRNLQDDGGNRKIIQRNLELDGDIIWRMP